MSEWKREESISVISCSSKETIRFSSQKRLLVWLSKILQRRDDARANYFYSSLSFDDAPLSCPQTWWTVSFVLRCCCCSPFWCFVVDNRRRVVVMSDCFLCLYPRNKKWRQKWKFRQKNCVNSETEEEEGRDSVATNRYVKEMRKNFRLMMKWIKEIQEITIHIYYYEKNNLMWTQQAFLSTTSRYY